jgi:drug/metabolite transporter (DMT)-like permease
LAIGLVVFGDFPDGWTWVGVGVITASGVFISVREQWALEWRRFELPG